jgi:isopentenyl-diphosphate delta-isomerase
MNYYQQKQFIARIDKDDKVLGKIEKWEAHKKGIPHRGFTAILEYKNDLVIQHRKHPAFDGVFDLSFSFHQIYINNVLQTDYEAIYSSLAREWNLTKKDLATDLKFLGKIYYKAKDQSSIYTEHEIDYIYIVETKVLPVPNFDFAYGFSLVKKSDLKSKISGLWSPMIAPWVKKIIEAKFIK